MKPGRSAVRLDIVWTMSFGLVFSSLAAITAPSDISILIAIFTPAFALGALWVITQSRLARHDSPEWLVAYSESWRRSVAVLAVLMLMLSLLMLPIGMLLAPPVWLGLSAVVLLSTARDYWALAVVAVMTLVAFALTREWAFVGIEGTSVGPWLVVLIVVSVTFVATTIAVTQRSASNRWP